MVFAIAMRKKYISLCFCTIHPPNLVFRCTFLRYQVVHAAIIHVAIADMDATYAANVAVVNTTVNDTNINPKKQIKNVFGLDQGKNLHHGVMVRKSDLKANLQSKMIKHKKTSV